MEETLPTPELCGVHMTSAIFDDRGDGRMEHFVIHHSFDHILWDIAMIEAAVDANELIALGVGTEANRETAATTSASAGDGSAPGDVHRELTVKVLTIDLVS